MRGITRAALAAAAALVLSTGVSNAAQPSAGCNGGSVPPGTTPVGIGLNQTGTPPGAVQVKGCNPGTTIPVQGAITVNVDPNTQSGYVDVDGDSTNTAASCAKGYVRVSANSGGPSFYESKTGSWSNLSHAESPDAWAQNIANNCSAM